MEDGRKNPGFSSINTLTNPTGDTFPRPLSPLGDFFPSVFPIQGGEGEGGGEEEQFVSVEVARRSHLLHSFFR
jgi:hypothetical protein